VRHIDLIFEPDLRAPSMARRALVTMLPELAPEAKADALIIVSELVANAVLHGEGPVVLHLAGDPDRVRIEVEDCDPAVGAPHGDSRGLDVVAAVARGWGVDRHDGGKTVWAELPPRP
jgi:hypothetical protein